MADPIYAPSGGYNKNLLLLLLLPIRRRPTALCQARKEEGGEAGGEGFMQGE